MDKRIHKRFSNEILDLAAKRFGAGIDSLKELGGFESYIYEYGPESDRKILRVTHEYHRKIHEVSAEMEWLDYLSKSGARVAAACMSENNLLVEKIEAEDSYFLVTALEKAPGIPPNRELWSAPMFKEWGRAIGELHRLTKNYVPKGQPRFQWYDEYLVRDVASYIPDDQQLIKDKATAIIDKIKDFKTDKNSYGLIHTDVHQGNFFCDNGRITIFDFDDCAYKHFVSDIAIAVFYSIMSRNEFNTKEEFAKYFISNFMEGYIQENSIDSSWLSKIDDFLKLREIILYVAICRSIDPKNPDEWCNNYLKSHRKTIENDVPILNSPII